MTVAYKARVWEVGTITGAGPYNLPNTANSGSWRTVAGSGLSSGQNAIFCLQDTVTNAWELSLFTYTSGSPGTLTRVQFLESSTGSAITFAGNFTNITLEIPSPIVASAGTTSSGLIPALNTSGILDSSFTLQTYTVQVGSITPSGTVTYNTGPSFPGNAVSGFSITLPASTAVRTFLAFTYMASHSIANGIAITLDGNAQCFSSMDESQDGDYNVANIAGFILTIPGDNATHQVAITVFNTGAGTSGNLDFGTLTLKQLS